MPSRSTYHLTWVSLTLGVGYLLTAAPAKRKLLLTLNMGYLLTAALPDLQHGIAPLGPPAPVQPQPWLFGCPIIVWPQVNTGREHSSIHQQKIGLKIY